MFAFELDARLSGRGERPAIGRRMLQLLARLKKPARIPHDYREIAQFRANLELRRVETQMLSRFKIM